MRDSSPKIEVRSFSNRGWRGLVDAATYEVVSRAVMRVIPRLEPGMTLSELKNKAAFHIPRSLIDDSDKLQWWVKVAVQNLEFQGEIERSRVAKPLKWHRA